jgi:Xaa-Pro aminopeptidase
MYFENITYVPIDLDAVEPEALNATEKNWLNAYHAMVFETMAPLLDEDDRAWLKNATRAI